MRWPVVDLGGAEGTCLLSPTPGHAHPHPGSSIPWSRDRVGGLVWEDAGGQAGDYLAHAHLKARNVAHYQPVCVFPLTGRGRGRWEAGVRLLQEQSEASPAPPGTEVGTDPEPHLSLSSNFSQHPLPQDLQGGSWATSLEAAGGPWRERSYTPSSGAEPRPQGLLRWFRHPGGAIWP